MAAQVENFNASLGAILTRRGSVDVPTLARGSQTAERTGERLDLVLTRLGLVEETSMAASIGELLGIAVLSEDKLPTRCLLSDILPRDYVLKAKLFPAGVDDEAATIAMVDPLDSAEVETLRYALERRIDRVVVTPALFERAVDILYSDAAEIASDCQSSVHVEDEALVLDDVQRLRDIASEAPVIRLVNELIVKAVEAKASDIHVEPEPNALICRYRIDGSLRIVQSLALASHAAVVSRLKILAKLDIAERRLPQDGRIRIPVRGRRIDLRVSTMPSLHGETVVLRVLDQASLPLDLPLLGFSEATLRHYDRLLRRPNGIIFVTGPTGSGKTTTLYASLAALNRPEVKIFTVEDPIEYELAGIRQIQVRPQIGLTFAASLRSILRQDPDIIMVGEIRDRETAEMAIQSALTGHLVLSTVHTNSAAATITRLLDMGVEGYLLASTVRGILAQRLVRKLCRSCARQVPLSGAASERLGAFYPTPGDARMIYEPGGCELCRGTGYNGRTTISELLVIDDKLRGLMSRNASEGEIEAAAEGSGMVPLRRDGLLNAREGFTSLEEVLRVSRQVD